MGIRKAGLVVERNPNFFIQGMSDIARGRDLAAQEMRQRALRGVDIRRPETFESAISSMAEYGDVSGQKELFDIVSQYEMAKARSGKSAGGASNQSPFQYRAGSPEDIRDIAAQQLNTISVLMDAGQNIDEAGYPSYYRTAAKFGFSNWLPEEYSSFDEKREQILGQAKVEADVLSAVSNGFSGSPQTSKKLYDIYSQFGLDLGKFDENFDYATIPASTVTAGMRAIAEKTKQSKESEKGLEKTASMIAEQLLAEESIFSIRSLLKEIKAASPDIDEDQVASSIISRIKRSVGENASPDAIELEISNMLNKVRQRKRMMEDKTPRQNDRIEAINRLRGGTSQ